MNTRNWVASLVASATLLVLPALASASTLLTLENPGSTQFQQTTNSPCVIGDPSCNNPAGFGSTTIPPNTSPYDVTSPDYTVSQIQALVGTSFWVGIDVNTATGGTLATEQLDYFAMLVNGVVQFVYDPASPGTQLVNVNNGNGYSDELLKGFSLSGFASNAIVTFRAIVNNATDGREEFFLISTTTPPPHVPEPATLTMFGLGLLGVGRRLARRHA